MEIEGGCYRPTVKLSQDILTKWFLYSCTYHIINKTWPKPLLVTKALCAVEIGGSTLRSLALYIRELLKAQ